MKRVDDTAVIEFGRLISNRIGLNIPAKDSESLHRILVARTKATKAGGPEGYLGLLRSETRTGQQEWRELAVLLTNGETYFFRDKGHFYLLEQIILPELIKAKGDRRTLRIWSAGCASGEEPYSIAILLDRFFPALRTWEVYILGTDINQEALGRARRGLYNDWSFRRADADMKREYFTRSAEAWEIDDRIKRMVTFREGNLIADDFFTANAAIAEMDIIICRNVFIYFKNEAVSGVINRCMPILNEGGYLITGHNESSCNNFNNLQKILFPEAVIFRKNSGYKKETITLKTQTSGAAIAGRIVPHPAVRLPKRRKRSPGPAAVGRKERVIDSSSDDFEKVLAGARMAANAGDYAKAESACREALRVDAFSTQPYLLLARIAEARGDGEEAKNFLKKVIYLDPACIPAYLDIGGLYERESDFPRAERMRKTAIALLRSLPPLADIEPYDSTAEELLKYLEYLMGSAQTMNTLPIKEAMRK